MRKHAGGCGVGTMGRKVVGSAMDAAEAEEVAETAAAAADEWMHLWWCRRSRGDVGGRVGRTGYMALYVGRRCRRRASAAKAKGCGSRRTMSATRRCSRRARARTMALCGGARCYNGCSRRGDTRELQLGQGKDQYLSEYTIGGGGGGGAIHNDLHAATG